MDTQPAPHALRVPVRYTRGPLAGQIIEAWPVDAREMVAHPLGGCEYVRPEDRRTIGATAPPVNIGGHAAVPGTGIEDQLDQRSVKELQAMARQAGVKTNQSKADLIAALAPHVAAGTMGLERPQDVLPRGLGGVALPGVA